MCHVTKYSTILGVSFSGLGQGFLRLPFWSRRGPWGRVCVLQSITHDHQPSIILRNRAEYHLILSRRGRRPSWLNQGIFRKIEQDNCFIIQQILIDYHFPNEKNYGSMMKTLKASNGVIKIKTELQEYEVYYRSLKKDLFTNSCLEMRRQSKKYCYLTENKSSSCELKSFQLYNFPWASVLLRS